MLATSLRHLLRVCRHAWVRVWAWLGMLPARLARAAFALVCWLIVALLLGGMFLQLFHDGGRTDLKVLAALLAAILPAAFLGAYGREVASRIKKLGPFELFEIAKATGYLEDLSALDFDLPDGVAVAPDQHGVIRVGRSRFSEKQSFFFERGDRYLNYLEYSSSEPTHGRQQTEHSNQLLTIGRSAFSIGEWTKAIHWLERLESCLVAPSRRHGSTSMSAWRTSFHLSSDRSVPTSGSRSTSSGSTQGAPRSGSVTWPASRVSSTSATSG